MSHENSWIRRGLRVVAENMNPPSQLFRELGDGEQEMLRSCHAYFHSGRGDVHDGAWIKRWAHERGIPERSVEAQRVIALYHLGFTDRATSQDRRNHRRYVETVIEPRREELERPERGAYRQQMALLERIREREVQLRVSASELLRTTLLPLAHILAKLAGEAGMGDPILQLDRLFEAVKRLVDDLARCERVQATSPDDLTVLDELASEVARYREVYDATLVEKQAELDALRAEAECLRAQVTRLDAAKRQAEQLSREVSGLRTELVDSEQERESLLEQLDERQTDLVEARHQIEQLPQLRAQIEQVMELVQGLQTAEPVPPSQSELEQIDAIVLVLTARDGALGSELETVRLERRTRAGEMRQAYALHRQTKEAIDQYQERRKQLLVAIADQATKAQDEPAFEEALRESAQELVALRQPSLPETVEQVAERAGKLADEVARLEVAERVVERLLGEVRRAHYAVVCTRHYLSVTGSFVDWWAAEEAGWREAFPDQLGTVTETVDDEEPAGWPNDLLEEVEGKPLCLLMPSTTFDELLRPGEQRTGRRQRYSDWARQGANLAWLLRLFPPGSRAEPGRAFDAFRALLDESGHEYEGGPLKQALVRLFEGLAEHKLVTPSEGGQVFDSEYAEAIRKLIAANADRFREAGGA